MRHLRPDDETWDSLPSSLYVPVYEISEEAIPQSQEEVDWEAITITDRETGEEVVLAFTQPKIAMLFLRGTIRFGMLSQAYKIGRFSTDKVRGWSVPLLLNPDPDNLFTLPGEYEIPGSSLSVD